MSEVLNNWLLDQSRENKEHLETRVFIKTIPKERNGVDEDKNRNDDVVFTDFEHNVYGVFDGVGTNEAGLVVKESLKKVLAKLKTDDINPRKKEEWVEHLRSALLLASDFLMAKKSIEGTTVDVVKLIKENGKRFAIILHAGDGRVYKFRQDKNGGQLEGLTLDHRVSLSPKVSARALKKAQDKKSDDPYMSDSEKTANRIITKDLDATTKETDIDVRIEELRKDEQIIIVSDGIHDNLTTSEMKVSLNCNNGEDPADLLVRKARIMSRQRLFPKDGGADLVGRVKNDDMSVVVAKNIE